MGRERRRRRKVEQGSARRGADARTLRVGKAKEGSLCACFNLPRRSCHAFHRDPASLNTTL